MVVAGAVISQITLKAAKHSAFQLVVDQLFQPFKPQYPFHIQILQIGLYTFPCKDKLR